MIYLTHRLIRILSTENMIKDDAKNKIEYGSDNMKPSESCWRFTVIKML